MQDFPQFMKNPVNAIAAGAQSRGVQGFVYDGLDGSQMAFWTCSEGGHSAEHVHDYDEYMLVVQGSYTLIVDGRRIPVTAGQEYHLPKGLPHAGEFEAGTRTIHAFGGKRAARVGDAD
jgi:quercetin dioxygenase-like cupin family protein